MQFGILVHRAQDDVGVAVVDLDAGSEAGVATLEGEPLDSVAVLQPIPLGHKVALKDLPKGHAVIEYGQAIGSAQEAVRRGEHVHTHNLRSLRW